MPKGHFGPAVIGEDQYEDEQQEVVTERRDMFGDSVLSGSNMIDEAPDTPAQADADEDEGPMGYEFKASGSYVEVTAPDGEVVESDSPSGKWHGKEAALEAAWEHAEAHEAERHEEADVVDLTMDEVAEYLAESPGTGDEIMRAEIQRPDGVRVEVIDMLEEVEVAKDDPRPEVLETLASLRPDTDDEE